MSFTEIKNSIAECSTEQRLELAALISHLNRSQDAENAAELDERMARMDSGRKVSADDLQKLHTELNSKGR